MIAVLGGAHTISNSSHNWLFNHSNKLKEGNLNPLVLLRDHCPQNIATDSYYIETITKQIAEKALEIFKDIEKSGGFLSQLKEGTIQRKIKENAQKEQHQFDTGDIILMGANKYPKEYGALKDLQINPFLKGKPYKTLIIPISPKRLAEKLEQKRLKNEA